MCAMPTCRIALKIAGRASPCGPVLLVTPTASRRQWPAALWGGPIGLPQQLRQSCEVHRHPRPPGEGWVIAPSRRWPAGRVHLRRLELVPWPRPRGAFLLHGPPAFVPQHEIEIIVERSIARVVRTGEKKRIAVGGRLHDDLCADIVARAGPVRTDSRCPIRRAKTSLPPPGATATIQRTGRGHRRADDRAALCPQPRRLGLARCILKAADGRLRGRPALRRSVDSAQQQASSEDHDATDRGR